MIEYENQTFPINISTIKNMVTEFSGLFTWAVDQERRENSLF